MMLHLLLPTLSRDLFIPLSDVLHRKTSILVNWKELSLIWRLRV